MDWLTKHLGDPAEDSFKTQLLFAVNVCFCLCPFTTTFGVLSSFYAVLIHLDWIYNPRHEPESFFLQLVATSICAGALGRKLSIAVSKWIGKIVLNISTAFGVAVSAARSHFGDQEGYDDITQDNEDDINAHDSDSVDTDTDVDADANAAEIIHAAEIIIIDDDTIDSDNEDDPNSYDDESDLDLDAVTSDKEVEDEHEHEAEEEGEDTVAVASTTIEEDIMSERGTDNGDAVYDFAQDDLSEDSDYLLESESDIPYPVIVDNTPTVLLLWEGEPTDSDSHEDSNSELSHMARHSGPLVYTNPP